MISSKSWSQEGQSQLQRRHHAHHLLPLEWMEWPRDHRRPFQIISWSNPTQQTGQDGMGFVWHINCSFYAALGHRPSIVNSFAAVAAVFLAWLDTLYQPRPPEQFKCSQPASIFPLSLQSYTGLVEIPQSGDAWTWHPPASGSHVTRWHVC